MIAYLSPPLFLSLFSSQVTFDNGDSDVFDTLVVAVGRYADTKLLGLEAVGVKTDPTSGKVRG